MDDPKEWQDDWPAGVGQSSTELKSCIELKSKMMLIHHIVATISRQHLGRTCVLVACLSASSWVAACQVPVFRYALERWENDNYEVLVIHDGQLNDEDQARLKRLQHSAEELANATVRAVNIAESTDAAAKSIWQQQGNSHSAVMAVLYPQGAREVPNRTLHVERLTDRSSENLFQSPLRTELAKRLEAGQSAVWIFVPSGHNDKDATALQTLNNHLLRCQQILTLPTLDELELVDTVAKEKASQMRVAFSTLTLDRTDSREQFFLRMLLASEDDLADLDEPLAFPVFGRGRVLYALVGNGINDEMIFGAGQFVVGPCSCQVKAQNPGFDLLMDKDWEKAVGDVRLSDPLPDAASEPVLLKIPDGRSPR
ncbi:MAG: hypothetical protein KDA72_08610 [Planctomycetales bacterium]|nr:hypothetical protein [Planctomycetales bacterium]